MISRLSVQVMHWKGQDTPPDCLRTLLSTYRLYEFASPSNVGQHIFYICWNISNVYYRESGYALASIHSRESELDLGLCWAWIFFRSSGLVLCYCLDYDRLSRG